MDKIQYVASFRNFTTETIRVGIATKDLGFQIVGQFTDGTTEELDCPVKSFERAVCQILSSYADPIWELKWDDAFISNGCLSQTSIKTTETLIRSLIQCWMRPSLILMNWNT